MRVAIRGLEILLSHLRSLRVCDDLIHQLRALVVGTVVDVAALIDHCSTGTNGRAPAWQGGYHCTYRWCLHDHSGSGWARGRPQPPPL